MYIFSQASLEDKSIYSTRSHLNSINGTLVISQYISIDCINKTDKISRQQTLQSNLQSIRNTQGYCKQMS